MGHFVGYASGCWELVKQPYSAYLVKSRIGMVTVWSHTVSVRAEKAKFQVAIVPCYFPIYDSFLHHFYIIDTSWIGKWEDWPHPKAPVLWGTGAGASTRRHNLIGWWHHGFQTTSADGFWWGLLYNLVGGLEHFLFFQWEFHNPNWLIFFRGVGQPSTRWILIREPKKAPSGQATGTEQRVLNQPNLGSFFGRIGSKHSWVTGECVWYASEDSLCWGIGLVMGYRVGP